jgi:hypothetical protein
MLQRNSALFRSSAGLITACWLALLSVSPASADGHDQDATFTFRALPAALTLSTAGNPRFGLLEADLTGEHAKRDQLTVTVKATEVIQFVRTDPDVVCTTSSASDRQHAGLIITTFRCSAEGHHSTSTETIAIDFRSPSSAQTCSGASSSCLTFNATLTSNRSDAREDNAWDDDESDDDEAVHASSTIRLFTPTNKAAVDGNCVTSQTTLGTLASQNVKQATRMTFGLAADALPCTPGTAGVDPQQAPTPLHTRISFVEVPKLNQPATVQVSFSTLPPGGSAHAFVLFELVGYKFGTSVSHVSSTIRVPDCQQGTIPAGHDACVLTRAPLGDGDGNDDNADDGVIVTLLVNPTSDPGFAG